MSPVSILEELEDLAKDVEEDAERVVRRALGVVQRHVQEHPQPVFAVLRRLRPILLIRGVAVITRFDDVWEVLTHDQQFTVQPYAPKMRAITGDFILGLDDDARYERDVSVLRLAVRRGDLPRIDEIVTRHADQIVAEAGPRGRIDVIDELTDRVPTRLIGEYFGTPGPDEDTLIRWAHILFDEIFINIKNDEAVHAQAMEAAAEMRPYLDQLIAERKATGAATRPDGDDVLGRLLEMQRVPYSAFSDVDVRSNLIGLIVGLIPTTSKATALALDELLRRPDELAHAQEAARADDQRLLRAYMWEAMRLNPQNPGLIRRCAVDYALAEGTHRERRIPPGTTVFAATQSAMLDGEVLDDPDDFRIDRPAYHYMHFGAGLHTCFGRYINAVQIPRIAGAILRQPGLRRGEGPSGELRWEGPFPSSLTLEFEPA